MMRAAGEDAGDAADEMGWEKMRDSCTNSFTSMYHYVASNVLNHQNTSAVEDSPSGDVTSALVAKTRVYQ
jgi:hypothetical protein